MKKIVAKCNQHSDLHSNIVLIKFPIVYSFIVHCIYLHSNMVLIKLIFCTGLFSINSRFTFQYGSNQIREFIKINRTMKKFTFQYGSNQILIIPRNHSTHLIFTFQYGSNQIVLFPVSSTPLIWFTFQYGSNQIVVATLSPLIFSNLHSNMVLIKLLGLIGKAFLVVAFTFQYGSNQINSIPNL